MEEMSWDWPTFPVDKYSRRADRIEGGALLWDKSSLRLVDNPPSWEDPMEWWEWSLIIGCAVAIVLAVATIAYWVLG